MKQTVITVNDESYEALAPALAQVKMMFVVCDNALEHLKVAGYLKTRSDIEATYFSHFESNPKYEDVKMGVEAFKANAYDVIFAIGGGSAMDVAKCIKLFATMDETRSFLEQSPHANDIALYALPTTAGTGSEATQFAVIYANGEKQSIADESIIPSVVIMDPGVLQTLPSYQKKATLLDALCHAVESFWSVYSTEESKAYSRQALAMILGNWDAYINNDARFNPLMLKAANLAGKAINITQTTAGHAMCYKLTSLYGLAHGHAAALCVAQLLPHVADHLDQCRDERGSAYLKSVMDELGALFKCTNGATPGTVMDGMIAKMGLATPCAGNELDYATLASSVNEARLKNMPIALSREEIDMLYHRIVKHE